MLANHLKSLHLALKFLQQACLECRKVIALEEQAISKHRIDDLEAVGLRKEKIYEDLKAGIQACQNPLMHLQSLDNSLKGVSLEVANLAAAGELMSRLATQTSGKNPRDKALLVLLADLKTQILAVVSDFIAVKPLIEKNKFIIATLLYHHQQSYQFWSDLVREKNANYNAQGAKQEQQRISQLAVRA